ncbi:BTB/POZ protein [Rhizophagus irregularis DAOM 181602=DAOM 197198]|nr:BTB/POZ protein [Rhizophagus irregularis DAOM 181602=DAOM 197198]
MEEIEIWEGLLKWCFFQQNVINDPTKWSKDDIANIEKPLHRDGFNATSFHRNCDSKGATIWIAKIKGTTQLIGGYNPLDWGGDCGWKGTTNSFLFHIMDEKNVSSAKVSYVNNNNARYAIYCNSDRGPHMGNFYCDGINHWIVYENSDVNLTYPNISIPASFTVENYEVFQVIKK